MTTVLIVDDMSANLRLLRKILTPHGFSVIEASTGEEALAAAGKALPDAALLDLRLGEGGMTGYDLATRLRAMPGGDKIAIVALSGGAVLNDEEASRAAGFDGYIAKPFNVAGLPETLKGYVRRRSDPSAG